MSSLIVPPPAEAVEPWSGELVPEALPVAARIPWHVGSTDDPRNWLPNWVFSRRIAAPARAPGYLSWARSQIGDRWLDSCQEE